ncbi:MAG: hypothetical protein ABI843_14620 [Dokdonella sp.]
MTLATLVNIASLISSFGVLISLVYLNRQLRQGGAVPRPASARYGCTYANASRPTSSRSSTA